MHFHGFAPLLATQQNSHSKRINSFVTAGYYHIRFCLMSSSRLELRRKLFALAERQGGYFTASQAVEVGYQDAVHGYHVHNGDWERVGWGIYRLRNAAKTQWSQLFRVLLWSRNRKGTPQGVFCGITGEAVRTSDPSLIRPGSIELCVPRSFRRSAPKPANVKLIFKDICKERVRYFSGLPVIDEAFGGQMSCSSAKPKIIDGDRLAEFDRMLAMGED